MSGEGLGSRITAPSIFPAAFLIVLLSLPGSSIAQDAPAVEPAPATSSAPALPSEYWLRVKADRVNVRVRPDVTSLIVARVDRDTYVRSTGMEGEWHRIVPPRGVFSLVAAQFVEPQGEHRGVVMVESGTLRVRAASRLVRIDPAMAEVQALLERGDFVEILERDGEWLRIAPPEGVQVYLHRDFCERVTDEAAARIEPQALVRYSEDSAPPSVAGEPASRPVDGPDLAGSWGQKLSAAQGAIDAESLKPRLDRDWAPILETLRPIAAQQAEPAVAERAAEWVREVELRIAAQKSMREAADLAAQQAAEQAERVARETRPASAPQSFDARGMLQPAFDIDPGEFGLRYKLVDPRTKRTTAYVEFPSDLGVNVRPLIGKYVGVSGDAQPSGRGDLRLIRAQVLTALVDVGNRGGSGGGSR